MKRKKVVFIAGDRKQETAYFAKFVLQEKCSIFSKKGLPNSLDLFRLLVSRIVIIEDDEKEDPLRIGEFLGLSAFCVFVITETDKRVRTKKILRGPAEDMILVLDFAIARKLKRRKKKGVLTFGVGRKRAAFYITDIHQKEGETNFKVNYGANVIPFWVKEKLKNKEIYAVLPALCLAKIFRLNLAEVSHRIREKLTSYSLTL